MKLFLSIVFATILLMSFTARTKKFKGLENFVFIPSGSITSLEQSYSCAAFYMLEHEVTNLEYRTFLAELKKEGKTEAYKIAYPDTSQWSEIGGYMNPMKEHYFAHPAYDNYPVVNVSKEGADLFCVYLTKYYRNIYGDVINDFRLPTKYEWVYAAKGGVSEKIYAWKGNRLRNGEGDLMANFCFVGDENITAEGDGFKLVEDSLRLRSPFLDDAYITAPANSYWPNVFGLYNMCGNVAEMVAKENVSIGGHWRSPGYDVRVVSEEKFEKANPFVGFRPVMSYIIQK